MPSREPCKLLDTACDEADRAGHFRVLHPFHPQFGETFRFDRLPKDMTAGKLLYAGPSGLSREIPVAWTSLAAVDPFRVVSAGRSRLHADDVLALAALLAGLSRNRGRSVKEIVS